MGDGHVRYEWGSRCAFSDPEDEPGAHEQCSGSWDLPGNPAVKEIRCKCECHRPWTKTS